MKETKTAHGAKRKAASGGRFAVKGPRSARGSGGTVGAPPTVANSRQRRIDKIVGEYKETFRALAKK